MAKKIFGNLSNIKSKLIENNDITESSSTNNSSYDFTKHPSYQELNYGLQTSERFKIKNPLHRVYEGLASNYINYNCRKIANYGSYNYLGLNGHPKTVSAISDTVRKEGSSVSASRITSGNRKIHLDLENLISQLYQTEAAAVFVSGHATNVSVISCLTYEKSLILYDQLSHNSIMQGVKLSNARAIGFRHNDLGHLAQLLQQNAHEYEQVFIVVEGMYSMDGDIPDLPALIQLKKEYGAVLMVDEAHGLGVLGQTGRGIFEHYEISPKDIDIWMGTLSKTLSSCGGYIAANQTIIDILRYYAPGLVYSVGLSPCDTIAATSSLKLMLDEPDRITRLQKNSEYLLSKLKEKGFDTGDAIGRAIIPVIVGSSRKAVILSNKLFNDYDINAVPIMYPAVEENKARLRFFVSSEHTRDQLDYVADTLERIM
ncbi:MULTISPECIES: aminotransferase class I/II-fold pyridoxal phosphate-dependent enzyme [unclassified Francisella]|uniref:aminotransferase class I/II-fold pyridoxal phosphate-dependent enzyme n=1 Tax=unclassified Francisella TaxID=2610885 RepID=UPI002E30362D|nr:MULTISPECIES: aminotransferase class I/II-fold pyridoxal phosphate-dependent enzyme [unclassified Francisella]MED7820044.1 aminotransferase class I/II-fold pyridoxal phosphate-dependent enzyme [Francisella sp. 19S2-4]MED7830864.1 aminotransferase class I/II-fold pyridoxal phosphate-dependent enzyme [Francisella sp. 19S2-10]